MPATEAQPQPPAEEALPLVVELVDTALVAQNLEQLADRMLPGIARMMRSPSACLYIIDSRLTGPRFFHHAFDREAIAETENLCGERFDQISSEGGWQPIRVLDGTAWEMAGDLILHPLRAQDKCVGLLGLTTHEDAAPPPPDLSRSLLRLLGNAIGCLAERAEYERRLAHLNAYLTVSSMLSQSMSLHEMLEMTLYCCMDVASAETASVLLLDDEKRNFRFYQVEGPTKPLLEAATFPADQGLAGSVLQSQQSEIINDVLSDPRFYGKIDSDTGFQTRNMIAVPLIAGEEEVGVLEVLNKATGGAFTEEERLLLLSISEEIAFAIRNAKMFEYVANSYCRQRQGQASCRGCRRPLGSWTPCVRYREVTV